jgi:hypothetical protein
MNFFPLQTVYCLKLMPSQSIGTDSFSIPSSSAKLATILLYWAYLCRLQLFKASEYTVFRSVEADVVHSFLLDAEIYWRIPFTPAVYWKLWTSARSSMRRGLIHWMKRQLKTPWLLPLMDDVSKYFSLVKGVLEARTTKGCYKSLSMKVQFLSWLWTPMQWRTSHTSQCFWHRKWFKYHFASHISSF